MRDTGFERDGSVSLRAAFAGMDAGSPSALRLGTVVDDTPLLEPPTRGVCVGFAAGACEGAARPDCDCDWLAPPPMEERTLLRNCGPSEQRWRYTGADWLTLIVEKAQPFVQKITDSC